MRRHYLVAILSLSVFGVALWGSTVEGGSLFGLEAKAPPARRRAYSYQKDPSKFFGKEKKVQPSTATAETNKKVEKREDYDVKPINTVLELPDELHGIFSSSSSGAGTTTTTTTSAPTTTTTTAAPSPTPQPTDGSSSSNAATPQPATPSPPSGSGSGSSSGGPSGHHTFVFTNNGIENLWVAILGNPGYPRLAEGGFVMAPAGPPMILQIPEGWEGRIWARVACEFDKNGTCNPPYQPCCASGSCLQEDGTFGLHCADSGVAPTSLIEFSLDNPSPIGPYDVYDVSLVDGWSVPLSIQPINGTYNPDPDPGVIAPWCEFTGCDAAPQCPNAFAVNGTTLSCWSPCQAAVNQAERHHLIDRACCVCTQSHPTCDCDSTQDSSSSEYGCCDGGFGCTPYHKPPYPSDTVCDPWSKEAGRGWTAEDLSYISVVEGACRKVYSWQFDDRAATFQCRKTNGFVDYWVQFVTRLR